MPMNKIEEMIKELCPNGVEWKKIGEIAYISDYVSAGSFASIRENVTYKDNPDFAVLLRFADFSNGFDKSKFVYVDEHAYKFLSKSNLYPGDIVISNVGSCGLMFRCPDLGTKITLAPNSIVFRAENNAFFYYWLTTEKGQKDIERITSKSAMPKFNKTQFKEILVPYPPLPIQTEIVRILDKFVEQQEQLERLIELRKKQYEYYREEMLKNVNGERGKLIDLLIQPITDGPHVTPKFVDEGVPFISATAIYDGKIHLKDAQGFVTKDFDKECSKKYKPKKFDVYMVKSGSTTGKVALVDFDDDFNVWSPLAAMRTQNEIQAKYLYHLLQTSNIQNQVLLGMSQGSQPNLSMRTLEQFNVIIPNNEEQERIVNVLDKIESNVFIMKSALEASKKRYEYYRDEMMRF